MFQYKKTTSKSRRAARAVRYLHISPKRGVPYNQGRNATKRGLRALARIK